MKRSIAVRNLQRGRDALPRIPIIRHARIARDEKTLPTANRPHPPFAYRLQSLARMPTYSILFARGEAPPFRAPLVAVRPSRQSASAKEDPCSFGPSSLAGRSAFRKITKRTHLQNRDLPINKGDYCVRSGPPEKNEPILNPVIAVASRAQSCLVEPNSRGAACQPGIEGCELSPFGTPRSASRPPQPWRRRIRVQNPCLNFARPVLCLQLRMQKGRRTWNTFEEIRDAAIGGDPQAQCYLGVCYQNGQGVKQDYNEAVKWFKKSAEQNDPVAQCYLGVCYQAGLGVPQEYGQAAKWFREAAEQGDPAAQFNLGVLYETGQGVTQNYAEAVKWYHSAAEQGEPQAQFNLGVFYEQGHVVPQNYPEAVKWYRLAAEQEVAPAQCNLGLCYQTGRGVPQSTVDAVKWFIRAARQGDKTAQHNLGVHYATLEMAESATEIDENADPEQMPS